MDDDRRRPAGLVLAGGQSRRMGTDKALLELDGVPLLVRSVRFLRGFCVPPVLLAGGDAARTARLTAVEGLGDVVGVPDAEPVGRGPLGGLVAGLRRAPADLVAVLAVDLPRPSRPIFGLLAGLWRGEPAVVPEVAGRLEPLHALWARAALPALEARLAAGRLALTEAALDLGARVVPPSTWRAADGDAGWTSNLNRPEDLLAPPRSAGG